MDRRITTTLAVVFTALTILSCNRSGKSEAYGILLEMEDYMPERTESVADIMEEIEKAVRYFERNGDADEKLKMYYYCGCIKQDSGDDEGAMEMLVKGESCVEKCKDKSLAGRLYEAKMEINRKIHNYSQAISDAQNAIDLYFAAEDQTRYFDAVNKLAILYHSVNDSQRFIGCLKTLKENWDQLSEKQKSDCYAIWINWSCQYDAQEGVLKDYITEIKDSSLIMWSSIAYAHIWMDKPELAIRDLENALKYNDIKKDASYYYVIASAYEKLGDSKNALSAYKNYIEITDEIDMQIFDSDTKFVEERLKNELELIKSERAKERMHLIGIIIILYAGIVIYLIRKKLLVRTAEKKQLEIEKERFEQLYSDAIAERDALTKMIDDSNVKDEAKIVIWERLKILNNVIISHITDSISDNKKAYQKLEALVADRETFIESTRLTIEGNSPKFIAALKEKGLTDEEINICCLYVIGMKGKDIKTYTNQSRHYIQSGEIRHKLGLMENDTNLSIHLKNMFDR